MAGWLIIFGIMGMWRGGAVCADVIYSNYTLLRMYPSSLDQMESISNFSDPEVEVLKRSRDLNDSTDVLVPQSKLQSLEKYANDNKLVLEVKDQNYGRKFELPCKTPRRRTMGNDFLFRYHSFDSINRALEKLAQEHPNTLTLKKVGESYEGRDMLLARISTNPKGNNPTIFVDAGIHAREWVAPAMALYLIHRLVEDKSARSETNGVDWLILPVVNPDGYEFTRKSPHNRMWRKTMSPSTFNCIGVDGNRNYGFKWGVSGISRNPCDKETYAGAKPFTEPETIIVKNIMHGNKDRIKLYISMHAYGQYLVYPWGYTGDFLPKSWKKLDSMARKVSDAVEGAGGQPFKVMSAGKWYPAAGGSDDYAFGGVGIPYSYTMELTDGHEFIYPERLLQSTLPKFYPGFKVFAHEIKKEFGSRRY